MCRDLAHGGRRCPLDDTAVQANRDAQKRFYLRKKARAKIAALAADGIHAIDDLAMPTTWHYGHRLDPTDTPTLDGDPSPNHCKPSRAVWTAPGVEQPDGTVSTEWTDHLSREGELLADTAPRSQRLDFPPTPGEVLVFDGRDWDDEADTSPPAHIEVVAFTPRYDGENDQISFVRVGSSDVEHVDLEHNDLSAFTYPNSLPVDTVQPEPGFAEEWKADNGSGFTRAASAAAARAVAGEPLTGADLPAVRTLRAVAAAEPENVTLHRGLWIDPTERNAFLAGVQADGYTVPLGSFTTDPAVARDFALGVDSRPENRDPRNAVIIETVGAARSIDLWSGSDEPERISAGHFTYDSHTVDDQGVLTVRVRQGHIPTPEQPNPARARRDHKTLFAVDAAPGAVVVQIDSLDQLDAAATRWPRGDGAPGVSFDKMRADGVDALSVSPAGIREIRSETGYNATNGHAFYGWDMPSVAWLHSKRMRVKNATARPHRVDPDEQADDAGLYDDDSLLARLFAAAVEREEDDQAEDSATAGVA